EDVQRARAVDGDEVGDVDESVNGTEPDRAEPPLQPLGRRAVLHPANEAKREGGAKRGLFDLHGDGTGEFSRDRLQRSVLQLTELCGGKLKDASLKPITGEFPCP